MKAALIGLGVMGLGMARNILAAGLALRGFDLSTKACDAFTACGGTACDSAASAVAGCDVVVLMVVDAVQMRTVLFDSGVADAMPPGGVVVMTATLSPGEVRDIASRLDDRGIMTIDAPVSGGQVGAEAGTLTLMASGAEAAFDRVAPVLSAIAGDIYRLGTENGIGATYKVVHQLAAGINLAASAELMTLGVKAGCDPATLLDIVSRSAGHSWMLENRGPRMMEQLPTVTSAVNLFVKDIGLALDLGGNKKIPLPLAAAAHQMFVGASAMGHGTDDDSLVIRAYEALSGAPVYKGTAK